MPRSSYPCCFRIAVCLFWTAVTISFLLVVAGVAVIISSDRIGLEHARKVEKFNEAAEDWENVYRPQFSSPSMKMIIESADPNEPLPSFQADIESDDLNDPSLSSYSPFKWSLYNWHAPQRFVGVDGKVAVPIRTTTSSFDLSLTPRMNLCKPDGETYENGCLGEHHELVYMRKACQKIAFDGKSWKPSALYSDDTEGFGCGERPEFMFRDVVDNWSVTRFEEIPSRYVHLTIRSVHDPYVIAMDLTHGTGNFGISSKQAVVIGVSLLSTGLLLLAAFFFLLCIYRIRQKTLDEREEARYQESLNEQEHNDLLVEDEHSVELSPLTQHAQLASQTPSMPFMFAPNAAVPPPMMYPPTPHQYAPAVPYYPYMYAQQQQQPPLYPAVFPMTPMSPQETRHH